MQFKCITIYFTFILNFVILCGADKCSDNTVMLDEEFIGCCRGRPRYTSEPCIDDLLANDTFSEECLINCMYREFEIYDGSEIDMDGVKTFIDVQIMDEDFNLMYKNAFESCSKLSNESLLEKFSFVEWHKEYNCDEYPILIDICVWYHSVVNCPGDYANNDETCNNKREWVNECLLES